LEFRVSHQDETSARIALMGVINEDSDLELQKLGLTIQDLGRSTVAFDFSEVRGINSLGVRAWIQFLRRLQSTRTTVLFEACPPEVVMQINMVPNFLSGAKVVSFYANYVCETCNTNVTRLIHCGKSNETAIPAHPMCLQCGAPMESEELEDEYFAFLSK
jgi:anti-anti-sigma regulatory factor